MVPFLQVMEYVDPNGVNRFQDWLAGVDPVTRSRIRRHIDRLAQGHAANIKSVGAGVFELRMDFGPGYRAYFGRRGPWLIILLMGGDKRRQSADIEKAKALWAIVKEWQP